MAFLSCRSAALISFVSCVERSNSSLAFASRRCSLRSAIFASTAATSGALSHGSRLARSSSRSFSRLFRASSLSARAFALASRFLFSSSRFFFRSSSPASSSRRLASAASCSFLAFSSASDCKMPLNASRPGESCRHFLAAFSQFDLAWALTTFVSAFTSLSLIPKASARDRSSVVRSTAANSGCQTCTKSTGTALSASRDDSLQKSKPTGFPALRAAGSSAPATVSWAPSLAAMRMPTLAFVEHTSMACFLPALRTISRASPKPFDWTSAIFCSASQVFDKPLPQPEPSFERFSNVDAFSAEAASSSSAFAASLLSSWATRRRSAAMTGSAYMART
mmetsp:Transcript_20797/g.64988  ORF Transcript_20797/g.64988 Transcript_20797/m.64988 type:complete len:337 (+) Transcript_20797:562-1572(+)